LNKPSGSSKPILEDPDKKLDIQPYSTMKYKPQIPCLWLLIYIKPMNPYKNWVTQWRHCLSGAGQPVENPVFLDNLRQINP
jgi:hypothetical protein